jgi:hypothetical protein
VPINHFDEKLAEHVAERFHFVSASAIGNASALLLIERKWPLLVPAVHEEQQEDSMTHGRQVPGVSEVVPCEKGQKSEGHEASSAAIPIDRLGRDVARAGDESTFSGTGANRQPRPVQPSVYLMYRPTARGQMRELLHALPVQQAAFRDYSC